MTQDEVILSFAEELGLSLVEEVIRFRLESPQYLVNKSIRLDENTGHFFVSETEILVFDLDKKLIPELQIAMLSYYDFIAIEGHPTYYKHLQELIIKAREICPPAVYHGHEVQFKLHVPHRQHFIWWGHEFLSLPMRQCGAYYDKRTSNLAHFVKYPDE